MGSPISLSSNTPDFEGFVQVNEHTVQERYSDYSRITIETMVHGSPTSKSSLNNPGSPTGTNSSGQSSNSSTNHKTSRLEVIKRVYQSKFPNCRRAIDLLAAPIRKSSINEYERKKKVKVKKIDIKGMRKLGRIEEYYLLSKQRN